MNASEIGRVESAAVAPGTGGETRTEAGLAAMRVNWIGFWTLFKKEVARFLAVPGQTVASPVITTSLYFLVFGYSLGPRLREMHGMPYIQYIVPGLVMLSVISSSFLNTSSSLFGAKVMGTIVDILVTPLAPAEIVAAMLLGALVRATIVGFLVWGVAAVFVGPLLAHPLYIIAFVVLVSVLMGAFGLLVATWSDKFEQLSIVPTFVLTPLTYLGGVFYTLDALPDFWRRVSLFNPIVYLVNGLRYGMVGVTDVPIGRATLLAALCAFGATLAAWSVLRSGWKLRA